MFQKRFKLSDLEIVADEIISKFNDTNCFVFYAEMGSGKTTLINKICEKLGVVEQTSSPTFSIINEYITLNGNSIFHIDCYRLKNIEDAINTGIEDILKGNNSFYFIELPQIIEEILPENCIRFSIEMIAEDEREIREIAFN